MNKLLQVDNRFQSKGGYRIPLDKLLPGAIGPLLGAVTRGLGEAKK